MRASRLCLAAAAAVAAIAAPHRADAQNCTSPPAVPATEQAIKDNARIGISALKSEAKLAGAALRTAVERRRGIFRQLSRMNWRIFCSNRAAYNSQQLAAGLVRGVVFFYLSNQRNHALDWVDEAQQQVKTLLKLKVTIPDVLNVRLDRLLSFTAGRLQSGNVTSDWELWIGAPG